MRQLLATAAIVPLLLACVPLAASATPPLSPEQRALGPDQRTLVAETCDRVMGLSSGGIYRQECMDSLARSAAGKAETAQLVGSYVACRGQGLHEGTAAFSTCMLDSPDPVLPAVSVKLAYDSNTPENSKSYFDVSNRVHWRREQYACAQIGLTPGTASFGECTAGLEAALMPNPF
ncbi:MAG TPA: hypothetical protein VFG62_18480 [Rhodopila sp.]|jgi:hypothetical protein|nr:hypothetical protein [Rhodopila sp.]